MKIQDLIFLLISLVVFWQKESRLSGFLGLSCLVLAIFLFQLQVFFTAERLTWYAAAFFTYSIFFQLVGKEEKSFTVNKKALFSILAIALILFNLSQPVLARKPQYFTFNYWQRFSRLEYIYQNSQYVSKEPKVGFVPDEVINAYAGGAYIKGVSPILIAPDTPPLGRYLIGISAYLINNENMVSLLAVMASVILLYFLGKQIFQKQLTALIPPMLLSFEPIFKNQLVYTPLLDILQLPFLLMCFLFFNLALKSALRDKRIYFVLASLSLGAFISIKFFITGITIIGAWFMTLILTRERKVDKNDFLFWGLSLPASVLVLLASYFRVFWENHSLKELFGIQKWVFLYHQSQLIYPFSVWPLILFNRWHVWFGDKPVISDPQWRVTWPICLTLGLGAAVLYLLKKISPKKEIEVVLTWIVAYIAFLSIGQTTSRYLLIYLPVLYVASIYLLEIIWLKLLKNENWD